MVFDVLILFAEPCNSFDEPGTEDADDGVLRRV